MDLLTDTLWRLLLASREDVLLAGAVTLVLLAPGAFCCWIGYRVIGVRLARGVGLLRARRRGDRIEQRLESICTALSILTDSTETGLRETISGLERLSGAAPAATPAPVTVPPTVLDQMITPPRLTHPADDRRTAREIAIAEGVSEGEVLLRLRLQNINLQAARSLASQSAYCN
jgi:hypothetical protein